MAKIKESNLTDENLITLYVKKGDEEAFDGLITKYLRPIYSFVYKNVGNTAEAEDITQEVFLKVWKNIRKFDRKRSFKPWLFQIAKNASIDYLRKKKAIPFSNFENEKGQNMLVENMPGPSVNMVESLSDKRELAGALQYLSRKEQKIIDLRHNEGMSFKEIAGYFQESINTIKSRYRRTLVILRKNIKN